MEKMTTKMCVDIADIFSQWLEVREGVGFGFGGHLDTTAPGGWAYTLEVPANLRGSLQGEFLLWAGMCAIVVAFDVAEMLASESPEKNQDRVREACTQACCTALAGIRKEILRTENQTPEDKEAQTTMTAFLLGGIIKLCEETFGQMIPEMLSEFESRFEMLIKGVLASIEIRQKKFKKTGSPALTKESVQSELQEILKTVKPNPAAN